LLFWPVEKRKKKVSGDDASSCSSLQSRRPFLHRSHEEIDDDDGVCEPSLAQIYSPFFAQFHSEEFFTVNMVCRSSVTHIHLEEKKNCFTYWVRKRH